MSITIIQQMGQDSFQWTLRKVFEVTLVEKSQIILNDSEQDDPVIHKTIHVMKYNWLPDSPQFVNFLKVLLVSIILENGANDSYRCNVALHIDGSLLAKDMHTSRPPVPPVIKTKGNQLSANDEDHFASNCIKYEKAIDAYYNNILCSYSWAENKYDDYVQYRDQITASVADIVECFVYMNCENTMVE